MDISLKITMTSLVIMTAIVVFMKATEGHEYPEWGLNVIVDGFFALGLIAVSSYIFYIWN